MGHFFFIFSKGLRLFEGKHNRMVSASVFLKNKFVPEEAGLDLM